MVVTEKTPTSRLSSSAQSALIRLRTSPAIGGSRVFPRSRTAARSQTDCHSIGSVTYGDNCFADCQYVGLARRLSHGQGDSSSIEVDLETFLGRARRHLTQNFVGYPSASHNTGNFAALLPHAICILGRCGSNPPGNSRGTNGGSLTVSLFFPFRHFLIF